MKERIPSLVAAAVLAVTGTAGLVDGLRADRSDDRVVAPEWPALTCAPGPAADPGG